jgi:hypothetical protein
METSCIIRGQFLEQTNVLCKLLDLKNNPPGKLDMELYRKEFYKWFRLLEEDKKSFREEDLSTAKEGEG